MEAARRALLIADCDRVLVMDAERLVGAGTESDLLRRVSEEKDCRCRCLTEVVGCDVATLLADESIDVAAAIFRTGARRLIVLLESGKVIGSVRPRDVMVPSASRVDGAPHVGTTLSSPATKAFCEMAEV